MMMVMISRSLMIKILDPVCCYESGAKAMFAGKESLAGSFCCASSS